MAKLKVYEDLVFRYFLTELSGIGEVELDVPAAVLRRWATAQQRCKQIQFEILDAVEAHKKKAALSARAAELRRETRT